MESAIVRIRNTSSDRNFRNFLRQRANVLDGLNRHPKNCLHHYAAEIPIRAAINTILKLSYYFHALSRFDKPADERHKDNLIILFADENLTPIKCSEGFNPTIYTRLAVTRPLVTDT